MSDFNAMSFGDEYRDEFLKAAYYFAAPTGVALAVVLAVFSRYDMMFTKLYVALTTRIHGCGSCCHGRGGQVVAWTLLSLFFLTPLFLLIAWGALVATTVKPSSVGVSIPLLGVSAFFFVAGMIYWHRQRWRMSAVPRGMLATAAALVAADLIQMVVSVDPFSYEHAAFAFLSLNFIFISRTVFVRDKGVSMAELAPRLEAAHNDDAGQAEADTVRRCASLPCCFGSGHRNSVASTVAAEREAAAKREARASYLAGTALLLLFGVTVLVQSNFKDASGAAVGSWIGFMAGGSVIFTDTFLFAVQRRGLLRGQRELLPAMAAARIVLAAFAPERWFLALSFLFLLYATSLLAVVVRTAIPVSEAEAKKQAFKQMYAQPSGDASTSGAESSGGDLETNARAIQDEAVARDRAETALSRLCTALRTSGTAFSLLAMLTLPYFILLVFVASGQVWAPDQTVLMKQVKQSTVGVSVVSLCVVLALAFSCLRYIQRDWGMDAPSTRRNAILGTFLLTWVGMGLEGWLFYTVTGSYAVFGILIFTVPALLSAATYVDGFVRRDFSTSPPPASPSPRWSRTAEHGAGSDSKVEEQAGRGTGDGGGDSAGEVTAEDVAVEGAGEGGAPATEGEGQDVGKQGNVQQSAASRYTVLIPLFVFFACCGGVGAFVSVLADPPVLGTAFCLGPAIVMLTVLPLWKYLRRRYLDKASACWLLLAFGLVVFLAAFLASSDQLAPGVTAKARLAGVLALVAAYPSVTGLIFSFLLWRKTDYGSGFHVKASFGVGIAFPLVAAISIAAIYPSSAGLILGGFACFYATSLYILFLLVTWVRSNFFLRRPYRRSLAVVVVLVAGIAAVAAVASGEYFVGISTAWLALALLLLLYALASLVSSPAAITAFIKTVLPTYQLAVDSRELTTHNGASVALVVGTWALVLWGLIAAKHVAPAALGVGVSCAAGLFLSLVVGNASTSLRRQLAEVADFLDIGTLRSLRDRTVDLCKQTNEEEDEEAGGEEEGRGDGEAVEAEGGDAGGAGGGRPGFVDAIRKHGEELSESQLASALDSVESFIPELGFREDSPCVLASAVPAMTRELQTLSRAVHQAHPVAQASAQRAFALYKDRVDRQFALESRFEVHFTLLAVMAGRYLRKHFERDLREFVMSLGLGDVSAAEIASWPPAVLDKLTSYLLRQRAEQKRRREAAARERKKRDQSEGTRVAVNVCDSVIPLIDSGDEQYVQRKINDIIERCKATAALHEDPDFPPYNAMGVTDDWRYPTPDLYDGASVCLYKDGIDATDLLQGSIGNCWFISAMASVAGHSEELVISLFMTSDNELEHGVCCLRLHRDGAWYAVLVDTRIPWKGNRAAFVSSNDPGELWPCLLEKAYAKLFGSEDGYEQIKGGLAGEGMSNLTGYPFEWTSHDEGDDGVISGKLWRDMLRWKEYGYLIGCGAKGDSDANKSDLGIVEAHAYSILDVRQVGSVHLLQLRNPWGQGEWKGEWSDESDAWKKHPEVTRVIKPEVADDGAFWMAFDDYVRWFRHSDVVYLAPPSLWESCEFEYELTADMVDGRASGTLRVQCNPTLWLHAKRGLDVILRLEQAAPSGKRVISTALVDTKQMGRSRVKKCRDGARLCSVSLTAVGEKAWHVEPTDDPRILTLCFWKQAMEPADTFPCLLTIWFRKADKDYLSIEEADPAAPVL